MSIPISVPSGLEGNPLSLWMVGHGDQPQVYCVTDRKPNTGTYSFVGMSLVERAALRALCEEAIRMIDDADATADLNGTEPLAEWERQLLADQADALTEETP